MNQTAVATHKLMGEAKVLLVEDDRSVVRMLRISLRNAGFGVHAVETGQAALEALHTGVFDVVVLDLGLPDGRSREVLDYLGRQDRTQWIVITAQDRAEATQTYGHLGKHFLAKPFDPWGLGGLIQGLLSNATAV